jgi:hypothetical protein
MRPNYGLERLGGLLVDTGRIGDVHECARPVDVD